MKTWKVIIIQGLVSEKISYEFPKIYIKISPSLLNQQTPSAGEVGEKREPYCTVGGNADWRSPCGKHYGVSSKH